MDLKEQFQKAGKDPDYRKKNMAKAREARAIKERERKLAVIKSEVDTLAEQVDDKVEEAVEKGVQKILSGADPKKIKQDFFRVFYKVGGVKGMIEWINRNPNNKIEYYKLLISLLKTETMKLPPQQAQAQKVVINIISPNKEKETIIDSQVDENVSS